MIEQDILDLVIENFDENYFLLKANIDEITYLFHQIFNKSYYPKNPNDVEEVADIVFKLTMEIIDQGTDV